MLTWARSTWMGRLVRELKGWLMHQSTTARPRRLARIEGLSPHLLRDIGLGDR